MLLYQILEWKKNQKVIPKKKKKKDLKCLHQPMGN